MALFELETPTGVAAVLTYDFSIGRRGYDPEEVHAHLRRVADEMGRLQGEVDRRRAREELLQRKIASAQEAAYARVFRRLMDVMRAAEETGGRIRGAAEDEARAIVAAAREEADRIVGVAREDAGRLLARAEARTEASPAPPAPPVSGAPPAPAAGLRLVPAADLVVSVQEPAVVRDLEELERSLRRLSEDEWETADAATLPAAAGGGGTLRPAESGQDRPPDLSLRLQAEVLHVFTDAADGTDGA